MDDKIKEIRKNTEKAQCFFSECLAFTLGPAELKSMMEQGNVTVLDVRNKEDYIDAHIPGAVSIPKDELTDNLDKLSKDKVTIVYCYNQQCHLGVRACLTLAEYGYPCMHMEGGFDTWVNSFRYATVSGE